MRVTHGGFNSVFAGVDTDHGWLQLHRIHRWIDLSCEERFHPNEPDEGCSEADFASEVHDGSVQKPVIRYLGSEFMIPYNYTEFIKGLTNLVKNKFIPMSGVDDAVKRILRGTVSSSEDMSAKTRSVIELKKLEHLATTSPLQ